MHVCPTASFDALAFVRRERQGPERKGPPLWRWDLWRNAGKSSSSKQPRSPGSWGNHHAPDTSLVSLKTRLKIPLTSTAARCLANTGASHQPGCLHARSLRWCLVLHQLDLLFFPKLAESPSRGFVISEFHSCDCCKRHSATIHGTPCHCTWTCHMGGLET